MVEYIDEEEKDFFESLYADDWQPNPDKNVNRIYEEYARYSLELSNKIELNITSNDFENIQVKALEAGIPYQSIVSLLIHQYNEGKISLTI
ncbi:MAG: antitoxin [Candidatus Kapabacteria bacterium]|nr:antitoxin [Candidatus Kapabacteria bacterium]